MVITTNEDKAVEYAKSLNPNIQFSSGINWHWMHGFSSTEEAKQFDKQCREVFNLETRGVYTNANGTADVRFRD